MKYNKTITLKNGKPCLIRNCEETDAVQVCDNLNLTHEQTDFLLSYPDENCFSVEQEEDFLKKKNSSDKEILMCAVVDEKIIGTAGLNALGELYKVRHRAELGVSVEKDYWGLGIGRALTEACIACAREAGYSQLELEVVADNLSAVSLYKSLGFMEYGRNPKGFCSRNTGWQEVILMRMEL